MRAAIHTDIERTTAEYTSISSKLTRQTSALIVARNVAEVGAAAAVAFGATAVWVGRLRRHAAFATRATRGWGSLAGRASV